MTEREIRDELASFGITDITPSEDDRHAAVLGRYLAAKGLWAEERAALLRAIELLETEACRRRLAYFAAEVIDAMTSTFDPTEQEVRG